MHNPTLPLLAQMAINKGVDRLALVRRPDVSRQAGIWVIMISRMAVREVGSMIRDYAERIQAANPPDRADHHHAFILDPSQPVYCVFDMMFERQRNFVWHQYQLLLRVRRGPRVGVTPVDVLSAAFVGTQLCHQVAKDLTRLGCPASLT